MDSIPIKAALSELERASDTAREALSQIEREHFHRRSSIGGFEEPELALPEILNEIEETLLIVLEAAGLSQTRERLLQKWAEFENKGGIGKTRINQFGDLESRPLSFVEQMIDNLRACAGEAIPTKDAHELALLERLLRKTPVLVRARNVQPTKEKDVRDVMHDYLEATFTEYRRDVKIPGIIGDFKPDGGVRNLKAAIEFKFADSQQELSKAMGGIFEDVGRYSGSLDWTRFYSVIYQTQAFESEDRIKSEMARAGTLMTWKTILVTGAGARPRRMKHRATRRRNGH